LRLPLLTRILSNKEFQIVSGLIIFAASFRIPTLGSPFIEDEAISFNRYIDVPWKELILSYHDTNQHTLLLLFSKFFVWIFGESEVVFRLPSFLGCVLSIPLAYRLGLAIKLPWSSALLSSILIGLSWPHLKYSMEGRGYGLTIFLVLFATHSAVQFLNSFRWTWGCLLIGSGFAMTMVLPSNLFFLCGLAVFMILVRYFESGENNFSIKKLIWFCLPLLIMFAFVGIYFLIIYEGLKYGKNLHPLALDGAKVARIAEFLVAPWGFCMYLFFILGAYRLREVRLKFLFAAIFLVPIVLTLVTGMVGFARTYVYWLPFVLFLSSFGMFSTFLWFKKKIGSWVYGVGIGVAFLLIFFPVKKMAKHYSDRSDGSLVVAGPNATLSEASRMAVWVDENIPEDNLIVICTGGPESSVLNRYMGKKVLKRMIHFSRGRELKKIIFIAHQGMPPWDYPFVPMIQKRMLRLPASKLNKIHSIGSLAVYGLDLKIEQFVPPIFDPDYEGKLGNSNIPQVDVRQVEKPRVVGKRALRIENQSGKLMDIASPIVKGADISEDHAYLLYVFITDFKPFKDAYVHLAEKEDWPPTLGYLNPSLGMFHVDGQGDIWNIFFSLSPLSKGRHFFQERIGIQKGSNYYDGLQSYLLTG